MTALDNLHNRIDLVNIPFTERGSRLLVFRKENELFVRLAERWSKWEKEVGHYRQRPPIVEHLAFLGEDGAPLDFQADTYPHLAKLSTSVGEFKLVFLDAETLLLRLPSGRYGLRFLAQVEERQTDRRGGVLKGKRSIAYTTNAHLLRNTVEVLSDNRSQVEMMMEADDGDALMFNITPRLGFNRSVPMTDTVIEVSRAIWQRWFDATPPVLDEYRQQYDYAWWIMRSGLLSQRFYFTREALVPSKIHYVGVWHWDQFFHSLAYRYVDTRLAEDQIRIVLDHQRPDGMLPDAIHDEGLVTHLTLPVDADVTKPPLAAWTVLKLFEQSGHFDFLDEVYASLTRWQDWWMVYSCNSNGLCEYRHPFSSGLDDSPLWDEGMPVVSPDLNTYICLQQESLARIAELIGNADDAKKYHDAADEIGRKMVKHLWSEERGAFLALHDGKPVPTLTLFSLLPLWTGRLPGTINQRLLNHLTDPTEFWPDWPLPTVALSDPSFDPMQMWRGPTWTNINYLFVEALFRIGQRELARRLRRKTLELIMLHPDIYEYFNPITGERPPKSAPMYGWSAATFIDLAIQESQAVWEETKEATTV